MNLEFLRLAEVIREEARGETVSLLINPGNWGDALIRFGTERFLETFQIPYRRIRLDTDLASRLRLYKSGMIGGLLLCTGSGSWCGHYNYLHRALEKITRRWRFRRIIVLPSTFENTYDIPRTLFFRRDERQSATAMPRAEFCHDLAFFIGRLRTPAPEAVTAHCFRSDVESLGAHDIPADNLDLSAQGNESSDVHGFFLHLAKHQQIHTDRLHVAIGTALLGRQLHLYPGRYFKNEAIFRSSLEPYFDHVKWHDRFIDQQA
jgi:exopolysaccharide biosynthesis predicted pyruvyltransferase EpsI